MSLKIKKGAYILNPSCNISAANYGFMKAVMTAKKSFLKNASVYIGDINAKTAVRVYEENNFEKEEYSLFISEKGIEIYAYSGEEMSLNNFHFGDKTFDIEMKGSGRRIKSVILNGEDLKEIYSIPLTELEEYNKITVIRE